MDQVGMPFSRYVAIGDSSTEGLEDLNPDGTYRGWADRLAEHLADAQDAPLEYANLAVRGLRLREIRATQFDEALALEPDLMTIFGGVNDVIAPGVDFAGMRADFDAMFGEARRRGVCVVSFTVPDLSAFNPFGRRLRGKIQQLNDIIRSEAERHRALIVDFDSYPVASDPRLWFEDRLHGNALGHEKVAAALATRLGVPGFDGSWADPIDDEPVVYGPAVSLVSDLDWAVHHLGPWLSKGLRGIPHGLGITPKRPVPTVVPRAAERAALEVARAEAARAEEARAAVRIALEAFDEDGDAAADAIDSVEPTAVGRADAVDALQAGEPLAALTTDPLSEPVRTSRTAAGKAVRPEALLSLVGRIGGRDALAKLRVGRVRASGWPARARRVVHADSPPHGQGTSDSSASSSPSPQNSDVDVDSSESAESSASGSRAQAS